MLAASCEPSEIEVPRVARVTQVTALHDYDGVYVRAPRYGDEGACPLAGGQGPHTHGTGRGNVSSPPRILELLSALRPALDHCRLSSMVVGR